MKRLAMFLACAVLVAGCATKSQPYVYRAICPCGPAGEWTIVDIQARDSANLNYIRWQHLAALRTSQHVGGLSPAMSMAVEGASGERMPRWRKDGLMRRVGWRSAVYADSAVFGLSDATLDSILDDAAAWADYRIRLRQRMRDESW